MLIFGLILILLAVAVIAYVLLATADMAPVGIDYGILNLEVAPLWLYLSGVLTLAVAALGFWLTGIGARSKARQAREVRELRKQAKEADRRAVRATDSAAAGSPATGRAVPPAGAPGSPGARPTGGVGPGAGGAPSTTPRNSLEPDR